MWVMSTFWQITTKHLEFQIPTMYLYWNTTCSHAYQCQMCPLAYNDGKGRAGVWRKRDRHTHTQREIEREVVAVGIWFGEIKFFPDEFIIFWRINYSYIVIETITSKSEAAGAELHCQKWDWGTGERRRICYVRNYIRWHQKRTWLKAEKCLREGVGEHRNRKSRLWSLHCNRTR